MPDRQETRIGHLVGEYRLVHELGGGGFGTVYLAEHVHEHTQAAVKVLDIRLTKSEDFKDFINEARTMRLRHPHIVPLLDFGISRDNLPFLVMEYAPEGTLRDRHPKGECLPLSTVVSYVDQLASALQYAHDQRVIHRDIKPENILVRADGTLLVSDFGIAKLLEQSMLISQQTQVGTPTYMAPEQYLGYPCFASDQYALAVVVYEWICGGRPFQGTAVGLAVQHMNIPPPSLRDRLPTLPEAVERVIFKALAKAPEDRFGRIQQFADALGEAVHSLPNIMVVLSPPIEASNMAPPASPKQVSQPPSDLKSDALPRDLTDTEAARPELATQTPDVPVSYQRSASVLPPSPQDSPRNAVPPSPRKPRRGSRISLLMGGALGLILLLWVVLAITIGPIMSILRGPSPTPETHQRTPTQKWAFTAGSTVYSSSEVVDGMLYVGSWDRRVYAIDTSTGQEKWDFSTGKAVSSSPTVQGGVLYVGSNDGNVYALNANTGQKIWAFATGNSVSSSPTVQSGVLYVGSIDGNVYALDAGTGGQKWVFPTGFPVHSSPAVVNGVLYVGSWDHQVYALDANTGQKIWAFATGDAVSSSPIVVNGVVYIGSYDSSVYALDASTGQQKWVFSTGYRVYSSPIVVDGVLYVGSEDHKVYALDASTGQEKWVFPTDDIVDSSPTVVNGILYVGSNDHRVYALDASTGRQKWAFPTGDLVRSSPTVVNGVLYVGSYDHKVYALTLPVL